MDKRCSIVQYTYQSFFQFANVHFKEVGSTRQLCCVQSVLLIICAISVMLVCLIRLLHLPYDNYTPIVVFVILSLSAAMCGVFICGYFLPFCNSKGALMSLLISVISTICILYLFVSHNQLPELKNDCTVESSRNTTVQIRSFNMEKMILMVSYMPVQSHPIFVFVIALLVCPIVSLFTGGQDQMRLDWNLVVLPCSGSLSVRTTYGKRPFVESESFRYAQHTAGPGLLKNQR
ncbi:hypothetical protein DICVIV_07032 [Dictyocaulus viviparus]|uniref:Uncharacterized protein n=1 Tax=Dictyocaulus viviparus TaxID=29172 RepID=A0A0D8XX26_DICVI|nr:hypothetical protein DICVIV_07032 [Dictyocaulus viviparus]